MSCFGNLTGYGGVFCEKVHSISIASPEVYIAMQPPSRGIFHPRGNISLTFSTSLQHGILLFFSETTDKTVLPHRLLIVELYHGHVKISFSIETGEVDVSYSMANVRFSLKEKLTSRIFINVYFVIFFLNPSSRTVICIGLM